MLISYHIGAEVERGRGENGVRNRPPKLRVVVKQSIDIVCIFAVDLGKIKLENTYETWSMTRHKAFALALTVSITEHTLNRRIAHEMLERISIPLCMLQDTGFLDARLAMRRRG